MIHVQEEFAGYGPGKLGLTTVPSRFVNSFLLSQEAVGVPACLEFRGLAVIDNAAKVKVINQKIHLYPIFNMVELNVHALPSNANAYDDEFGGQFFI